MTCEEKKKPVHKRKTNQFRFAQIRVIILMQFGIQLLKMLCKSFVFHALQC